MVLRAVSGHNFISVSSLGPEPDSRHARGVTWGPPQGPIPGDEASVAKAATTSLSTARPAVHTQRGERNTRALPPGHRKPGPRGDLAWARGPGGSVAPVTAWCPGHWCGGVIFNRSLMEGIRMYWNVVGLTCLSLAIPSPMLPVHRVSQGPEVS